MASYVSRAKEEFEIVLGRAARVLPLPPRTISSSAKARPLDAGSNCVPLIDESPQLLPPNQAFEATLVLQARHAAQEPTECAEPGCTKPRVKVVKGGMQRVFCHRCELTSLSSARDRPLPRFGRRQTRASRPPQRQPTDAGGTKDGEILDAARLRDEFCGNLPRYKQVLEAEFIRRRAADAAHAERAARLAAAGRCAEPGCTKPQAFGLKDSNKTEFCRDHKKEGMVNLCQVYRCRQFGCTLTPTFGVHGTKIVEFCSYHKKEGMVNEVNKKCIHSGCIALASHGIRTGRKRAEVCSRHARAGMVNVLNGRPKRQRTPSNTGLQCALTGAPSNGSSKKRARRVGVLQRTSPIQPPEPDAAVKNEIEDEDSCPSRAARKVIDDCDYDDDGGALKTNEQKGACVVYCCSAVVRQSSSVVPARAPPLA